MIKKYFEDRIRFNKFNFIIFLELIVISLIAVGSSYFFKDELFLFNENFNYYYVLIMIIGLYYGLASGFILVVIFSLIGFAFYSAFPFYFFIHSLLISLIAGEFNFYFKINTAKLDAEVDYLKDKLRQIGKTALFTKLSHDNLEKSYFTKPYTLRGIVLNLSQKDSYEEFLKFLSSQFHIQSFVLVEGEKVFNYNMEKINLENELIEKMFEKKNIVYLNEKSEYLAAIPIMVSNDIESFIVIKEMPFIYYNTENLLAIQFSAEFFYLNKNNKKVIEKFKNYELSKYMSLKAIGELYNLIKLKEIVHANSVVILFDIEKLNSQTFENFLISSLRALDFFEKISFNNQDLFIVVLPFTSKEGGVFFVQRVLKMIKFIDLHNAYQIYEIENLQKITDLIKIRQIENV